MAKKKKVNLQNLLTHQKQQELRKNVAEEAEQIETLGQESEEKAVKWVQEVEKEREHEETEKSAEEHWILHDNKQKFFTYQNAVLTTCRRRMVEYDEFVPKGFYWIAQLRITKKLRGLEIWIRDPKDRFYCKAMKISGDPVFDLNWIDNAIQYGLNQMDELDQKYKAEEELKKKILIKGKDGKEIYL